MVGREPTAAAMPSRSSIFQRPDSPSERWWRSLMKSSRKPIAPQPSVVPKIASAGSVYVAEREERDRGGEHDQQAAHRRRALLASGAPAPPRGSAGRSSLRRRKSMKRGPARIEMTSATSAAIEDACHAVTRSGFAATASSPTAASPSRARRRPG